MLFRIVNIAVLMGLLISCGGESQNQTEEERDELGLVDECVNTEVKLSKSGYLKSMDLGDGSDGEFYLAYEDEFQLEEKTYNFINVNLDQGSLLTIADELLESGGVIQINSLGVCNLLGDVDLADYRGAFILNCNSSITMSGSYTHPNGNTTLSTSDALLTSEETLTNISESTLSTGSLDISGAELSTISANVQGGVVIYSSENIVIQDRSQIITVGDISFEAEAEDESLTNCSI